MALSPQQSGYTDHPAGHNGDGRPTQQFDEHRSDRPKGLAGRFREQPLLNGLLLVLGVAAIVIAVSAIGPASQSSGTTTRTATVKDGVVQSTVSGSGDIASASELDLGFKTSGTVTHIYVKQGQQVAKGQLLATVDPESAEVTLEQAKATLQSAEANLAELEENEGESSSSSSPSTGATENAPESSTGTVSYTAEARAAADETTTTGAGAPTTTATTTAPDTTTAPTSTAPATSVTTTTTPATTTTHTTTPSSSSNDSSAKKEEGSKAKQSEATREANLASAKASVRTDKLTVKSDEDAVESTKLYAPEDGTIVTLSGEVGQTVSASGTSKASSSSSSASSSSSSSTSKLGSTASSSSPSSSEGASSSSTFMVLSDLNKLQLVVALSESEIGNVHDGQIATVTIEALNGRKVAAHVVSVAEQPSSTSGAASYDVTFALDQSAEGLKVGMSATAEVVIKQAEGLNVPTSAVKGDSVTVLSKGKQVTQVVTTGLAGDTSTIILSGLKAGETVVLPSTTTTSKSSSSSTFGTSGRTRSGLSGISGAGGFPTGAGGFPGGAP